MEIAGAELGFSNVALFAVALFLLAGVYSFIKQGIKFGALILLIFAGLAVLGGVLWL
ncbi:hypothetical protein ACFOY4_17640 [Actinomadura syzygii]|uniref:hypothetical protein n=1 Tax=Actinomadura syzygii TaxID=1427538 RepID=UPI001651E20F|nr:hypothetical protein [Actinomadura syzygii]